MWSGQSRGTNEMKSRKQVEKSESDFFQTTDFTYSVKVCFYSLDEHSITILEKKIVQENSFHVPA